LKAKTARFSCLCDLWYLWTSQGPQPLEKSGFK